MYITEVSYSTGVSVYVCKMLIYIIVCIYIGVSVQLLMHHLFRKMKQITVKMITLKWGCHRKCPPPTFLLARDLLLRQFAIDCCQNAFASWALPRTPLGGLQRPQTPARKCGSHTLILRSADTENEPPPFPNPGYGPVLPLFCTPST